MFDSFLIDIYKIQQEINYFKINSFSTIHVVQIYNVHASFSRTFHNIEMKFIVGKYTGIKIAL